MKINMNCFSVKKNHQFSLISCSSIYWSGKIPFFECQRETTIEQNSFSTSYSKRRSFFRKSIFRGEKNIIIELNKTLFREYEPLLVSKALFIILRSKKHYFLINLSFSRFPFLTDRYLFENLSRGVKKKHRFFLRTCSTTNSIEKNAFFSRVNGKSLLNNTVFWLILIKKSLFFRKSLCRSQKT